MAKKSEIAKWRRTLKFEVQQHNRCQVAVVHAPICVDLAYAEYVSGNLL